MKRLSNSKGAAAALGLLMVVIVGFGYGWCVREMKAHWKEAKPPTKKIHIKVIKEDPGKLIGGKKVLVDIPVTVPDSDKH